MESERARRQHYGFVHDYLRDKCLLSPAPAIKEFFHEKATEHLKAAWIGLGPNYKASDEDFIGPDGIEVVPFDLDGHRASILVFPKPVRLNEAFMSALVVPSNLKVGDRGMYFTLEYNPDRPTKTFIGKWTDGGHFNLGAGPIPTVENFQDALRELLKATPGTSPNPFSELWSELERNSDTSDEATVARMLMSEAMRKPEMQQILDADFGVCWDTRLLEARNAEALLQVQKAIMHVKRDADLNFTGFYLDKTQLILFREAFDNARNKSVDRGENNVADSLGLILSYIDEATHPECGDMGFCINIGQMPEISLDAAEQTYANCQRMRGI